MEQPKKLKRVPLKEELMVLTGDAVGALTLQQMIYWSERTRDVDEYLKEEASRALVEPSDLTYGWIYKKSSQLADEIMGIASPATVRRRLQEFVERGWLEERQNPKYLWDKTLQYRVNIMQIQIDLFRLGYVLEGYPLQFDLSNYHPETPDTHHEFSNDHGADSDDQVEESSDHGAAAIPEITTESTIRDYDPETTTEIPALKAREIFPVMGTSQSLVKAQPIILKEDEWGSAFMAFCDVAGHDLAALPPNAPATWRARLRQIGEDHDAGPDLVEMAIRLKPFSDIAFKDNSTWRTPWSAGDDIGYLILCYKSGKYGGRP